MERRADGWHLELVAFGGGPAHSTCADERVAAVGGLKELRQVPLKRDGWERRDFQLSLDSKGGHEHLPIQLTILAYGPAAKDDFVPDLSSADGVLFLESGDDARDARLTAAMDADLAKRAGGPPRIVEHAKEGPLKVPVRTLVKRAIHALKAGELQAFWKESERNLEAAHDAEIFGPLTKEAILGKAPGTLVEFMLRVVFERGRRAVRSGRLANSEAYDRCLNVRWQRLLVVNALEMLIADAGVGALFGGPGARAMEREDVTAAVAGLKRIGAAKKAAIIERALGVAREANLWEAKPDGVAAKVLEELSDRFYAVDDEPLRTGLEEHIRKAPDDFTLGVYED